MMFGKSKKQPPIRSLIGAGTTVIGEIRFAEGLRIDGEIRGDVLAEEGTSSLLVISENARIHGKVIASHVIINGQILGPVDSSELLELQSKARVIGNVSYQALEMHQGATINGELRPLSPPTIDDTPITRAKNSKDTKDLKDVKDPIPAK
ncbi:cell shape determination protein CcmA [Vitreoscilla filiformis]|uniref:Cell shape determination protein CcmA n=2 Tax=Vitreoscilla filiformis TaxID=63 RepID=A0A221KEC7_VITFI|nr:cell shape determination protein CcmA [Vitreoscilla filiformis]